MSQDEGWTENINLSDQINVKIRLSNPWL